MLLIGSGLIVACNAAVCYIPMTASSPRNPNAYNMRIYRVKIRASIGQAITWMAMMEPLQNNVCLLSWAVACPWAFVLHLSLRTLARRARKRHALARGKRVAAAVSKGELRRG